jgi:hypothetical protein
VYALVAGAAALAAGGVVGITAATHHSLPKPLGPRAGKPPFAADSTVPSGLAAQVREAMGVWPDGTIVRLRGLAKRTPRSAFVHLNLGLAYFWARQDAAAVFEWRTAGRVQPDTPSAVRAQDLLHPDTPPGLPFFVPSGRPGPPAQARLLRGAVLQRAGRPLSAEREFAAAARLAPDDPEAQVAAAVGRFTKDHPERAFSRLGPLILRFPHAQTVRFHLGLLSIWIRDFGQARRQLTLAHAEGPHTRLGREAKTLVNSLVRVGTS